MDSERELTLIMNARNLAGAALGTFQKGVEGIGTAATSASAKVGQGFRAITGGITNGLGNLTETLAQGGGMGPALFSFGAYMAGQAAEAMIGGLLERMAGSSLVAAVGAPLAAAGSSIGGMITAAIPAGMALAPVLIVAAIGAAILFLVNNPEIAGKLLDAAAGLIRGLVDGLVGLGKALVGAFGAAWSMVVDAVGAYVGFVVGLWLSIPGKLLELGATIVSTIVGGLISLPGKIADVVRSAFASLRIDVGPFHISGSSGVTIDLPSFGDTRQVNGNRISGIMGHASGGWVGLHGPELGIYGESGPEYVIPNDQLNRGGPGAGGGVRIEGVTMAEIARAVEDGVLFRLRIAGTGQA